MKTVKTEYGQAYVVTAPTAPCIVTGVTIDNKRVVLLTADKPGQYSFVALSNKVEIDKDDAICTPNFSRAAGGLSAQGGGEKILPPSMLTLTKINKTSGNYFIKVDPDKGCYLIDDIGIGDAISIDNTGHFLRNDTQDKAISYRIYIVTDTEISPDWMANNEMKWTGPGEPILKPGRHRIDLEFFDGFANQARFVY